MIGACRLGAGISLSAMIVSVASAAEKPLPPLKPSSPPIYSYPVSPPPPAAPAVTPPIPVELRAKQVGGSITGDDYPPRALRNEEAGKVLALYTVGTDGRVSNCTGYSDSDSIALESATCTLIVRRFRFKPAVTPEGAPREERRVQTITWSLPEEPEKFDTTAFTATFTVKPGGKVRDCRAEGAAPGRVHAEQFCKGLDMVQPIIDAAGKEVEARVTYRTTVDVTLVPNKP